MKYFLVYPHQLFRALLDIPKDRTLVFIEDPLFFSVLRFHKHKLVLHRASMKSMEEQCARKGFKTVYLEFHSLKDSSDVVSFMKDIESIELFDPVDDRIETMLKTVSREQDIPLQISESPGFLLQRKEIQSMLPKAKKHYSQSAFYSAMRKKLQILLDQEGKPIGGKWSPKSEIKGPSLKNLSVPSIPRSFESFELDEAKEYIERYFPDNHGAVKNFYLPTNHDDALPWLVAFNHTRLLHYGDFEATVDKDYPFLYHSVLSPLINIGLITPSEVVGHVVEYCKEHTVPLTSQEGFLRQIIGWREFMRGVYAQKRQIMKEDNFMNAHTDIPDYMYGATSGLLPLDQTIKRVLTYGYCSHLERLMILGNFMLLTHIQPRQVYNWFMEMFVDSYDWITVPNVYGLSQFSTGPMISTKPYTSGSAYILRMSNYEKGDWTHIWDGLFWQFIETHKDYYKSNHRIKMMPKVLRRMSKEKKLILWDTVAAWRKSLS